MPIMLLQNLYLNQGLYNSTCLIITQILLCCIKACILSSKFAGQLYMLLRIKLTSIVRELLFLVIQVQFPICLSFAITINKLQGQSLTTISINLCYIVFTYGQLYIAMSYVTTIAGLLVLLPTLSNSEGSYIVINIVYLEVLLLQQISTCSLFIPTASLFHFLID